MADQDDLWGVGHDADLLPDVQLVAADLRAAYLRDPGPEIVTKHVAAMTAALRAPVIPLTRRRRRRAAVASAVVGAGIVLTGGLAAAGVLPTALQDGVAGLVRPIGVDLRHSGDHDRSEDQPNGSNGESNGGPSGEQPEAGESGAVPGAGDEDTPITTAGDGSGNPSSTAPGQTGEVPAPAQSAPGQSGSDPGRSSTAPGQTGAGGNNKPDVPPGQVDNPGQGQGKDKKSTTTTTVG